MKKPANLPYGVDDQPPRDVLVASALQHVGLLTTFLVFPLLVARAAGMSEEGMIDLLSLSLLALALGAILPSLRRGPVGSGFLCPSVFSGAYVAPSLLAAKVGGLPLVLGMTLFAGMIEMLLGRIQHRLRPYFPPEITGLVVMLIAIGTGKLGVRMLLGIDAADAPGTAHYAVGLATLAVMVGLSVWAKGRLKMLCALIGMVFGYALAAAAGLVSAHDVARVLAAPTVSIPSFGHLAWQFDASLIVPFAVAALGVTFITMGCTSTCQRINDADWERPDMRNIGRGVMANGVSTIASGLLGSMGMSSSSGAVGLAAATGVTSRAVALWLGAMFAVLAFFPRAAAVIAVMPASVMGAVLLFASTFVLLSGIEIVASRLLDARRTFVVGLSFSAGLSAEFYASRYAELPAALAPLASGSLVLGLTVAFALNLVFRVGAWKTGNLRLRRDAIDPKALHDFIMQLGASWGARRSMVERVAFSATQSVETIADVISPEGEITVAASFDGFRIDVQVGYDGAALELPEQRPTEDEILATDDGHHKLAGYLLRQFADRVWTSHRNGRTTLSFEFDH